MPRLLYLVHRLPYPPNKGDKISSFNMLRYFSEHYDVALGTFIDDPGDLHYKEKVAGYCEEAHFAEISPTWRRLRSLSGLLTGDALSVRFYADAGFQAWVNRQLTTHKPDVIFVFSGAMGQFVDGNIPADIPMIFDMEDVDSEKFRAFAEQHGQPLKWLYGREADRLLQFERRLGQQAKCSVLVTEDEAALFRKAAPEIAGRITSRVQGVDTEYFSPAHESVSPYTSDEKVLVFTGLMDYLPNIEAVTWFAENVMPQLRDRVPDAAFYIVGMRPTANVKKLQDQPGVTVTGKVDDVRPYIAHAHAACAPLQTARGIQNKVLEAMAMEKVIVASHEAILGIGHCGNFRPCIHRTPDEFINGCAAILSAPVQNDRPARDYVLENFTWDANLKKLVALFD